MNIELRNRIVLLGEEGIDFDYYPTSSAYWAFALWLSSDKPNWIVPPTWDGIVTLNGGK